MGSDMLKTVRPEKLDSATKAPNCVSSHRLRKKNDKYGYAADMASGCTTPNLAAHQWPAEEDGAAGSDSTVTPVNTPEVQGQYSSASRKPSHQEATSASILSLSQALIALPCHYALAVTHQLLNLVDHALERTGQGVEYAKDLSKSTRASLPKTLQNSVKGLHGLAEQAASMMPCCCRRSKQSR